LTTKVQDLERPTLRRETWPARIFAGTEPFIDLALEAFRYQAQYNPVYGAYLRALAIEVESVQTLAQIPFLPIRFFKTAPVTTGNFTPAVIFESSTTTGTTPSRHAVKELQLYRQSFNQCFEQFFGHCKNWCILALLPSYLERKNSSLVLMMEELMQQSGHALNGFYLTEHDRLQQTLRQLEQQQQPTLLVGVTFALLDFAKTHSFPLQYTTLIETGGMKGRKKELTRLEVHHQLQSAFQLQKMGAEYGMTELLSQAWSLRDGIFSCPPWMKVVVREEEDPLAVHTQGIGALNIIDLANIDSCCFIGTDDAGRVMQNGQFEILGRLDGSDIRGCSLLTA
jgi:hypothetical protein